MIQRIQSVWLFLTAMIAGALLMPGMKIYTYSLPLIGDKYLTSDNYFPLLIIASFMTLMPLVTIFMFKDRKRQKGMIWLSVLACVGFIAIMLMKVTNIRNTVPAPTSDSYGLPGVLLPVVAIVFLFLALSGVRKDDKLIKSLDRLR